MHASRLHVLKHRRKCHTKNNASTLLSVLWQLTWGVPAFSLTLGSIIWTLSLAIFSLNLNVYATADSHLNLWCSFFSLQLWFSSGLLQLNSSSVVFSSIHRAACMQLSKVLSPVPSASWFSCGTSPCVLLLLPFVVLWFGGGFFPTATSINCLP